MLREIVDEIFANNTENLDEANIIITSMVGRSGYCLRYIELFEELPEIKPRYNSPLIHITDTTYLDLSEFQTLENYLSSQDLFAESYFDQGDDGINDYWYGCIGIKKDYSIVSFYIRYDGLLCDDHHILKIGEIK